MDSKRPFYQLVIGWLVVVTVITAIALLRPSPVLSDVDLTQAVNSAFLPRTEDPALHDLAHQRALEASVNFSHTGLLRWLPSTRTSTYGPARGRGASGVTIEVAIESLDALSRSILTLSDEVAVQKGLMHPDVAAAIHHLAEQVQAVGVGLAEDHWRSEATG